MDYLIKRKFLTWGENTTLDGSRSSDPAPYLNTDEVPYDRGPGQAPRLTDDDIDAIVAFLGTLTDR